MLKVKSFLVVGQTITKNGTRIKDLAESVDKQVNAFLATLDGELVDYKINTELSGPSGDYAFVTILYKGETSGKGKK